MAGLVAAACCSGPAQPRSGCGYGSPLRRRAARHGWQPLAGRAWPAGANGSPASDPPWRGRCERSAWLYRRWRYAPRRQAQRQRTLRQLKRRLRQACRDWDRDR